MVNADNERAVRFTLATRSTLGGDVSITALRKCRVQLGRQYSRISRVSAYSKHKVRGAAVAQRLASSPPTYCRRFSSATRTLHASSVESVALSGNAGGSVALIASRLQKRKTTPGRPQLQVGPQLSTTQSHKTEVSYRRLGDGSPRCSAPSHRRAHIARRKTLQVPGTDPSLCPVVTINILNVQHVRHHDRRSNERTGKTGDSQENPPTSVIVRYYSRMRKSRSDPTGYEPNQRSRSPTSNKAEEIDTGRPGEGRSCRQLSRCTFHRTPNLLYTRGRVQGNWVKGKVTRIQNGGWLTSQNAARSTLGACPCPAPAAAACRRAWLQWKVVRCSHAGPRTTHNTWCAACCVTCQTRFTMHWPVQRSREQAGGQNLPGSAVLRRQPQRLLYHSGTTSQVATPKVPTRVRLHTRAWKHRFLLAVKVPDLSLRTMSKLPDHFQIFFVRKCPCIALLAGRASRCYGIQSKGREVVRRQRHARRTFGEQQSSQQQFVCFLTDGSQSSKGRRSKSKAIWTKYGGHVTGMTAQEVRNPRWWPKSRISAPRPCTRKNYDLLLTCTNE
ncbi:hypothetical protein PR048_018156 [Dryococelus australis]|uniref:Uncharacterized protein n=1 Tax=Dryococelus australis TaxID=614101 RepID=A0ABQ9HBI5_9NEOP|nr:hypothetical protein PR048_018156 [Dryococelus australis]